MTKKDATLAVNAFIDAVKESLAKKEAVRLIGFGTFDVKKRAARKGRNPRTKEVINIPERYAPVFRAASNLRDLVNR